jgi:hypothetical protein
MTTQEHRTRDVEWEIGVIFVAIAGALVLMAIAAVWGWAENRRLREIAPDGATTNVSCAPPRFRKIAPDGATTNVSCAPPRLREKAATVRNIGTCEFCGRSGEELRGTECRPEIAPDGATTNATSAPPRLCGKTAVVP